MEQHPQQMHWHQYQATALPHLEETPRRGSDKSPLRFKEDLTDLGPQELDPLLHKVGKGLCTVWHKPAIVPGIARFPGHPMELATPPLPESCLG